MLKRDNFDLCRSEWEHLIDEWIFDEVHRNILKRRLLDGVTYDGLAYEFDLSYEAIRKIVYKSQEKLFKKIK